MTSPLLLACDRLAPGDSSFRVDMESAVCRGFDGVEGELRPCLDFANTVDKRPDHHRSSEIVAFRACLISIRPNDLIEETSRLLGIAAGMRATCLSLTLPSLCMGSDDGGFARYQDAINAAYELLRNTRTLAESTGVTAAIEVCRGGCFLSPVEMRDLIDAAHSWAVGASLDESHIARVGSMADWIMTLRRRIHVIRLYDDIDWAGAEISCATPESRWSKLSTALAEARHGRPLVFNTVFDAAEWKSRLRNRSPGDSIPREIG